MAAMVRSAVIVGEEPKLVAHCLADLPRAQLTGCRSQAGSHGSMAAISNLGLTPLLPARAPSRGPGGWSKGPRSCGGGSGSGRGGVSPFSRRLNDFPDPTFLE